MTLTPDPEIAIRQKMEEYRETLQKHRQLHPEGGLSIDPHDDPIAQEAAFRLVEENLDRMITQHPEASVAPDEVQRIKREFRERVRKPREELRSVDGTA